MIPTLLLYGATGDLAGRFVLPALASLRAAGVLPDDFRVVAAARRDLDDAAFRELVAERLATHAGEVPAQAREWLIRSLSYRQVEVSDPASVSKLIGGASPVAAYLALPPGLFAPAITALGEAGLPEGSRIAVEKPFGEDLESAVALNALLARVAGDAGEQMIFRVDHVLGMESIQNLLRLRFANRVLEQMWNSVHIERVEILWEETLALEDRAGYYDTAGAVKDVMQNHMLQLLSLLAMEPPTSRGERDLSDRKVEALRAVRPLTPGQVAAGTRRARYTAGRLVGAGGATARTVPDYASEEGVDPARGTETFAEITLELDSPRWVGTQFVLRAGKALAARRRGVNLHFRPASPTPFAVGATPNQLWASIDGTGEIALHLAGPEDTSSLPAPLVLTALPPPGDRPAYARLMLDFLSGGSSLSVRGDEAEQAWRIIDPVLQAWADGLVPMEEYTAGSAGPAPRP